MNQTIGWQMDYIYFLYGLSFIMLAAVCLAMSRSERQRLPWFLLSLFSITHGLYEWIYHFSNSGTFVLSFTYIKAGLLTISQLFLIEFGRLVFIKEGAKAPGRWIVVPFLAIAALGGLNGPSGLTAMAQYVLGFGGGFWAAVSFNRASQRISGQARRWLESASISMALFAATSLLAVPPSPFFPANIFNLHWFYQTLGFHLQILRGLFIVWTTVAVWEYSQALVFAETGWNFERTRARYAARTTFILILFICLGLVITNSFNQGAREDLINESTRNINALISHLREQMQETEHAVISMAELPEFLPALMEGGEENIARANFVLDCFHEALEAPVCYLMDKNGTVIASSNRNDPDSYVGSNYAFRPYFNQAVNGEMGRYFGLGITSGERGYYASYPVKDENGNIAGVAVIKRRIESVELGFQQYPFCFFIDPHGIVFLSSKSRMLYKSFWPLNEKVQKELADSRQFGAGPFETISWHAATNGEEIVFENQRFLINRKQVNQEGWSIVLFAPLAKTRPAGLLGIIITFCLSVLTISFFVATQRLTESALQTATSEENYRSVFNGVNEAIIVHELGSEKIIDVNQKMCEMYKTTKEDAINNQLTKFVAGVSPYTVEDAAILIKKATDGSPQLFEWLAKDTAGRLFWTEINLKKALIGGKECVLAVIRDISERKKVEESYQKAQAMYMDLYENSNDIVFSLDLNGNITSVNRAASNVFGYTREVLKTMAAKDLLTTKSLDYSRKLLAIALAEKTDLAGAQPYEAEIINASGEKIYLEVRTHLLWKGNEISGIQGIARDITRRKKAEEALRESEAYYRTVFENTGTALAIVEKDTTITLVNTEFSRLSGYSKEETEGKLSWIEFVTKDELEKMLKYHYASRVDRCNAPSAYEFSFVKKGGEIINVLLTIALIPENQKSVASFLDITDRKRVEEQLKYLSLHDTLTGFYNRTFFEEEMRRLEERRDIRVGMLVCDIDGLKLVNDTLGHEAGDRLLISAAGIIKECFRLGDMVARIGGDEFAVLLPDCDESVVDLASLRIKEEVEKYNAAGAVPPLSMSIGFAVSGKTKDNLGEVFKEADNNMYREKLHSGQSARSAIVQTLMKALEARDYLTEGHADRLQELVEGLASAIGLPERGLADLRLLAKFHDIGKVGIPDRILFKEAPLTADEYMEMKRHSEIGHRIAQSNPDLSPIAGWILKHHEWWNGQGYPQGLKGDAIPLECRILAIADAYDAMTNDRPYRRALSREEAVAEIKRCAGSQFDPDLVRVFLQVLQYRF